MKVVARKGLRGADQWCPSREFIHKKPTAAAAAAVDWRRALHRRSGLGQRRVERSDLHRLNRGTAAPLHIDQRRGDAA